MTAYKPFAIVFGRADEPELAVFNGSTYVYANGDVAKIDGESLDGFHSIFLGAKGLEDMLGDAFNRRAIDATQAVPKIPSPAILSVFAECPKEDLDCAYEAMLTMARIELGITQAQTAGWSNAGELWVECIQQTQQMVGRVEYGQRLKVLSIMHLAWNDVALRSIDSAYVAGIYDGALQVLLNNTQIITQTKH